MPRWADRWIVVENWDLFQARRERPDAPWIKLYRALLRKPEWIDLKPEDQALLVNIWLAYADTDGRLRVRECHGLMNDRRTKEATRMFVTRSLERLNHAGFIGFSDDKPLPLSLHRKTTPVAHAPAQVQEAPTNGHRTVVCPACEIGGGRHLADCPVMAEATS